jgi:hypothetical protein
MRSLVVAKCIHHLETRCPTRESAIREELCHLQVDRDMSSKRELGHELSSVRRVAILLLCLDEAVGEEEIGMLRGGEHVVAAGVSKQFSGLRQEPYQFARNAIARVLHCTR